MPQLVELVFECVRRVDQKHATGGQALTDFSALDAQCGVQPGLAQFGGHGFQALGQVMGFRARDDGVPDCESAIGQAAQAFGHHVLHPTVIGLQFITGVAQDQGSARWRGEKLFDALEPVLHQHRHLASGFQLGQIAAQSTGIVGVQLKGFQAITVPDQFLNDERGARVDLDAGAAVEALDGFQIIHQHRGQFDFFRCRLAGQHLNPFSRFATFVGVVAVQSVQTRASVGVDHIERGFLFGHVAQNSDQNRVFEDVGMVAGVKGVAVTEHGAYGNRLRKVL